jgi:hypothetical protein
MESLRLPWQLPPLSDNHIPATVHQAFNARRLVKPVQVTQLRELYAPAALPTELLARLEPRHKMALTEEEADVLIVQLQDAGLPLGKPVAEASAPASAIPTPLVASAERNRPADFTPDARFMATAEQRDTILDLLRRSKMERPRKTKHMLNLLDYNQVRAEEIINELAEWLAYCESGDSVAA